MPAFKPNQTLFPELLPSCRYIFQSIPFMKTASFSAVAFKDGNSYSAMCPDLDVASQGSTIESILASLKEAIELNLERLSPSELSEIKARQGSRVSTTLEIQLPDSP